MKGGHARSGPAPDPNALRRDRDGAEWVDLPASGREGAVPVWPLAGKQTARERELWAQLWCKPQAVMWELRGQELEVALYVRRFREAEKPGAPVALSTLIVRQMEVLGLSSMGLRANKWRIGDAQGAVRRRARGVGPSSRERFKVVDGEAS
jgi:hypothetical protein